MQAERVTTAVRDEHRQTLRLQDGQRAYIRAGQSVPHVQRILVLAGKDRALLAQGVEYQNVTTTVTVRPSEWVDLGQLAGSGEEVRRAIAESGATREGERRAVLIKVE